MTFEEAVGRLADEDGVATILSIPGVWECVSGYYNNDAIKLMEEEETEEEEEEDELYRADRTDLCEECRWVDHQTCSLSSATCPCCRDTAEQMERM